MTHVILAERALVWRSMGDIGRKKNMHGFLYWPMENLSSRVYLIEHEKCPILC